MENELTTTEVKAIFSAVQQNRKLYRIDGGDVRFYFEFIDDRVNFYPSWTSVINSQLPMSPELLNWFMKNGENSLALRDDRRDYGSLYHILCGEYLVNGFLPINANDIGQSIVDFKKAPLNGEALWIPELQRDLLSFGQFVNDHEVEPIAVEIPLACSLGVAGCMDLVCKMKWNRKNIITLVDFKSGKKGFFEPHEIQLHAYKLTWEENYPSIPIDFVFNFAPDNWKKEPKYKLVNQTEAKSAAKLPLLIESYKISGQMRPSNRLTIKGEMKRGIGLDQNYQFLNIEEFIKAKYQVAQQPAKKEKRTSSLFYEDF